MIDLAEYTPSIMKFIKQRKLCAVCVFAHEGKAPSKLTYGSDPADRLDRLQVGNPYQINAEFLIWTPGEPVAQLIVSTVMIATKTLEGKKLMGGWYDISSVMLVTAVNEVVRKYFSDAQIVDHAELMRLLRQPRADVVHSVT